MTQAMVCSWPGSPLELTSQLSRLWEVGEVFETGFLYVVLTVLEFAL